MSCTMKLLERVVEARIRTEVNSSMVSCKKKNKLKMVYLL